MCGVGKQRRFCKLGALEQLAVYLCVISLLVYLFSSLSPSHVDMVIFFRCPRARQTPPHANVRTKLRPGWRWGCQGGEDVAPHSQYLEKAFHFVDFSQSLSLRSCAFDEALTPTLTYVRDRLTRRPHFPSSTAAVLHHRRPGASARHRHGLPPYEVRRRG